MRNKTRIKTLIVMLTLACVFMLCGFAIKAVKLYDENSKLIDLDKAVKVEPIGPGGVDGTDEEGSVSANESSKETVSTPSAVSAISKNKAELKRTVNISVRSEEIRMDDKETTLSDIKEYFSEKHSDIAYIELTDDYAEAETFKEVMKVLDEAGVDYEVG